MCDVPDDYPYGDLEDEYIMPEDDVDPLDIDELTREDIDDY